MYSRRNILILSGSCILPGIAVSQAIGQEANKWNDLIERGIKRDIIVVDKKAKSESFLFPQRIDKRYTWNYNMTRILVFNMKNISSRSYAVSNPGSPRIDNLGIMTDLYIPPVEYHEFVNRLKKTRALSRFLNLRIVENNVYFLNVHLHPLAELDTVPQNIMKKANLDMVKKGKLVIGLSKKLPEDHSKYVLLGAI